METILFEQKTVFVAAALVNGFESVEVGLPFLIREEKKVRFVATTGLHCVREATTNTVLLDAFRERTSPKQNHIE